MAKIDIGAVCHLIRDRQVPALSVRQPWTHRILHRGKDIENRTWGTGYRGWIMLHAGQTMDTEALTDRYARAGEAMRAPLGGIVGIVKVADVVRDDPSPWFMGPVGLVLRHPIAIDLVECPGRLGFFKPELDICERVIGALLTKARKEKTDA